MIDRPLAVITGNSNSPSTAMELSGDKNPLVVGTERLASLKVGDDTDGRCVTDTIEALTVMGEAISRGISFLQGKDKFSPANLYYLFESGGMGNDLTASYIIYGVPVASTEDIGPTTNVLRRQDASPDTTNNILRALGFLDVNETIDERVQRITGSPRDDRVTYLQNPKSGEGITCDLSQLEKVDDGQFGVTLWLTSSIMGPFVLLRGEARAKKSDSSPTKLEIVSPSVTRTVIQLSAPSNNRTEYAPYIGQTIARLGSNFPS